jgi:hypothetical protein
MAATYRIRELAKKIRALGDESVKAEFFDAMAVESLQLVDEGFAERRDPYGEPWAPTKRPNPILEKTGEMRNGWSLARVDGRGFSMVNATGYAPFQQYGTRHIVIRRMVPTKARGLGPIWGPRLREVGMRVLRDALK